MGAMFVRIVHPISGALWEFTVVDPTIWMGGKNSVAQFELIVSSFTTAMVFRRPDLFSKDPKNNDYNLRLLFSYLDDFMCAAASLQQAAMQYAFLVVVGG